MKQQLATTLYPETIKKLRMLAAEYNCSINYVLEVVLYGYESDDLSGKFNHDLEIWQLANKEERNEK